LVLAGAGAKLGIESDFQTPPRRRRRPVRAIG